MVEDIIDTGLTLSEVMKELRRLRPASLKLCCLLDKAACRKVPVQIDYRGCTLPDRFVVGYGIDCDEQFRNLKYIGYVR